MNQRTRIATALTTALVLFIMTSGPRVLAVGASASGATPAKGVAGPSLGSVPPSVQAEAPQITPGQTRPMPSLSGTAAMDYLRSHGLYNRLRDEMIASEYEVDPRAKIAEKSVHPVATALGAKPATSIHRARGAKHAGPVAPASSPAGPMFAQVKRLIGSDTVTGDLFAGWIAISGDTAVAGGPLTSGTGATYIFERNQGGPDNWGQVKKLTPPSAPDDIEGDIVAIDGDTLVVGIPNGTANGVAYVFERNSGGTENWGQVAQLTASDGASLNFFGASVGVSADSLIVGAPGRNNSTGAAYIFERNAGGAENWGQVVELVSPNPTTSAGFGESVAVSGDNAIIGEPLTNSQIGAAYVFSRNQGGSENWGLVSELTGSDTTQPSGFGQWVAISGNTAVVGAHLQNVAAGAAYIFEQNQGGPNNWGQVKELSAGDAHQIAYFGVSVWIDGDTLVVGSPNGTASYAGSAYVYQRNQGGTENWGLVQELTDSNGVHEDLFGIGVAVSAGTVMIGTPGYASNTGEAFIFSILPTIGEAFGASTIPVGATTSLTFTITAASEAGEIAFSDTLPAGLTIAASPGPTSTIGGTVGAVPGSSTITFSGGSLPAGGSGTVTVNVTGVTAGVYSNATGSLTSDIGTGAMSNSANIAVLGPPTIAKAFGASAVQIGQPVTLTFTLTNPNSTVALTGVGFTDPFPGGMAVANPANASDSCGGTFAPSAGDTSLTFSGGTIAAAGSCSISVKVVTTTTGAKTNITSAVTSANGGTGSASNSATVASSPAYDKCMHDDHAGDFIQFSSTTGQYQFTHCGTNGFVLTGTGTVRNVGGILTISDKETGSIVSIGYNTGTLTGSALITIILASGVYQTYRISDTNPHPVCACVG